jgi:hypothetical protein
LSSSALGGQQDLVLSPTFCDDSWEIVLHVLVCLRTRRRVGAVHLRSTAKVRRCFVTSFDVDVASRLPRIPPQLCLWFIPQISDCCRG